MRTQRCVLVLVWVLGIMICIVIPLYFAFSDAGEFPPLPRQGEPEVIVPSRQNPQGYDGGLIA